MCEILEQSHLCSQDYISRIKILISNATSSKHKNLSQKVLTTDMRDSRSWTEIIIFNHHLSGPMKSYNDFFFLQRPIYDKIPIDKIHCLRWAVY